MKIKIMLPVYASAEFEADIDIEGKTVDEIEDEFFENCVKSGFLCHQCSRAVETDFDVDFDNVDYVFDEIQSIVKGEE